MDFVVDCNFTITCSLSVFFLQPMSLPVSDVAAQDPMLSAWLGKSKTNGNRVVSAHISSLPIDERFWDEKLKELVQHHPGRTFRPDNTFTFALRLRPPYYTKSLFIEARSGGFIDCSWKKCVANFFGKYSKDQAKRSNVLNALRNEAFESDKMQKARDSLGNRCADCGKVCNKLVIDHAGMPFAQIVDEYVAKLKNTIPQVKVRYFKGVYYLRSGSKAWKQFHDERAELVGLCAGCNLRLGSRGYRSKPS